MGTDKLNKSIIQSNESFDKAILAETTSNFAIETANNVQKQLNTVVIEGDSSIEAAQARVDLNGIEHPTLKTRIDVEQEKISIVSGSVGISVDNFPRIAPEANDTGRIQRVFNAVNNGDSIIFPRPSTQYTITGTITVTKNDLKIIGVGSGYFSPKIKCDVSGTIMFDVKSYGVKWWGISFEGDGTGDMGENSTITAISFIRNNGSSDIDSEIHNCTFMKVKTCVYSKGKNVLIQDNLFSTSINGVIAEQITGQEVRGIRVINNRFHSLGGDSAASDVILSRCVSITGATSLVYKNEIRGNYADGIKTFFYGIGSETEITQNIIPWCRSVGIQITSSSGNLQIINNQMQDRYLGTGISNGGGIEVSQTTGAIIALNHITGKKGHGILLINSQRNEIIGNVLIDNDWDNTGLFDGIHLDTNSYYNTISLNTIDSVTSGKNGVRYGVNLQGNENVLGLNFIRAVSAAPVYDNRTANRGSFHSNNDIRRVLYGSSLANATANITTPATGDTVIVNNANEGQPCEYRYASNAWRLVKQAGIKRNNTVNRPGNLTASDQGLMYMDTSLSPNGKLIVWNGSLWEDMAGTSV
ncbi:right-handed parallel beta-helix repeat-containing protein [Bacillus cereus]|uniref:right-handed parallel beta-helix repeat-containing protein n=1 Tax=Bacillus cereus TaxID=1396 RepID=UPI0015D48CE4|nr:right-handed parallel beta-helix repeat-containing protein [Bacillus cereus]